MTPDEALRELRALTERTANIGRGDMMPPALPPVQDPPPAAAAAPSPAVAPAEEPPADAQTPLYNHLMSLVEATAQENSYVAQATDTDAALLAASRRRQIYTAIHFVAGVIVAVAVGRAVFLWVTRPSQPPEVLAAMETTRSEARVPAVADDATVASPAAPQFTAANESTIAADTPAAPIRPAADSSFPASRPDDAERPPAADAGSSLEPPASAGEPQAASVAPQAAAPPEAPTASPAGQLPTQQPVPEADDAEPVTVTLEPPPAAAPAPPSPAVSAKTEPPATAAPRQAAPAAPPAIETGSIGRPDAAVPDGAADALPPAPDTHTAWITSAVRMRGGPGNTEPVVATIGKGRQIEVIECKAWCEVIFDGQRGWVYKSFVGAAPPADAP